MKWEKVKLGDIATCIQPGPFGSQLHNSDYSKEGTPIIMPKDIVGGAIVHSGLLKVSEEHVKRLSRHQVYEGNLMVARKGDVRKCAYITANENGWMTGSDCLKVVLDESKCYPKFIYYQLRSEHIGRWLEKVSIGATMPSLNTGLLSGIEMVLPPIEIQKQIAGILSAYDDLIENNQKQIKLLEEAARRLYKEWFVDLNFPGHENTKIVDGVPEGWSKSTVGNICKLRKVVITPDKIESNTPYIGLEHMPRNDICLSMWGKSEEINSNKFIYLKKDVLFGKIRPYFHKVGFALNDGITSTDTMVMVADQNLWGLLLVTVSSDAFVDFSYQNCKEGAKMPRADWKQMEKYAIMIADQATQKLFEQEILVITNRISALSFQCRSLREARDRMLPKLMGGEVEV